MIFHVLLNILSGYFITFKYQKGTSFELSTITKA